MFTFLSIQIQIKIKKRRQARKKWNRFFEILIYFYMTNKKSQKYILLFIVRTYACTERQLKGFSIQEIKIK